MSKTRPEWSEETARRADSLIALRRDFHRHPELSHEERRTAEIIAERLRAANLDVRTGVGGTGVVGVLHGDRPGRTIAWRADIDALPLTEMLDAPFASGTLGVMHACGHDGHTAIAITMAEILAARRAEIPGPAVFLFQPAEEVLGGARPMILLGMQALVSREIPAQETAVLTVGQIVSGTKGNVLPDRAVMRGTIRAFDSAVRDHLVSRLGVFVSHIARAYRAEAEMRLDGSSCPAVVNHPAETALVREWAAAEMGAEVVTEGRVAMASDDMSLFLRERPGCYFRVGIAPATGPARPHHAPEFEMNEAGLPVGLRVGLAVMRSALAR